MATNKQIYPANNVEVGYKFWQKNFRNKLYNLVKFGNLPPSLPSSEVMYRVIKNGYATLFNHAKYGTVTVTGGLSGVDIYNNETTFVYSQPVLGQGRLAIGKDCAVITASKEFWHTRFKPQDVIDRYARLMADIDSTFDVAVVNARANKIYGSVDKSVRDSLKATVEAMRNGEFDVVTEPSVVSMIREHEVNNQFAVTDLITARDAVEKAFWEEFGIHYTARKTERFLKDEICGDSQILEGIQDNFVECLKDGVARCNSVLGTNITVEINPAYLSMSSIANEAQSQIDKGVNENV